MREEWNEEMKRETFNNLILKERYLLIFGSRLQK